MYFAIHFKYKFEHYSPLMTLNMITNPNETSRENESHDRVFHGSKYVILYVVVRKKN